MYYKITNSKEKHDGHKYHWGLNIFKSRNNKNNIRLQFSDAKHILNFLHSGIYLRRVVIPVTDKKLRIIKRVEPSNVTKFFANRIILKERYDLKDVNTYKMLRSKGVILSKFAYEIFRWACFNNAEQVLNFIIPHIKYKNMALFEAIRWRNIPAIKICLRNGSKIKYKIHEALFLAVKMLDVGIVKILLQYGCDINARNGKLLIDAIKFDKHYLYEDILKIKKFDDDTKKISKMLEIIELFINMGYDIQKYGPTLLNFACKNNMYRMVNFLIQKKIKPRHRCLIDTIKNEHGRIRKSDNFFKTIVQLINGGCNVKFRNNLAVILAARYGMVNVVRYLIKKGCNVKAQNNLALMNAIKYTKNYRSEQEKFVLVRILIKAGCNVKARNNLALMLACKYEMYDLVKFLICQGCNVHARKNMALKYASKNRNVMALIFLKNSV